ncbi:MULTISPECIES: VIT family protein [unclassified Luteimonas]|uniref:VIT1/CCC1 transporter family protein n=1 Tax=unclassified Luteimonas TaxID=2629088 RepID=UPI0018F0BC05|nr:MULTISPECIES: VIT family protein [unclassified Luteimonas]MBJ6979934.1 VIT family protein [Luteimonas sp. MC1895]MBJ6985641.1 VIT family protein [Luteimonas sp. MC1750]QQO06120.1 VIT family protein [Luteimonas sp. MC1750]
MPPPEHHRSGRAGWLRAAVLGANDGVVSISGLVVGVAAAGAPATVILASGVAGTVAGAFSMAAGEYVSVQSQADTEQADLALEQRGLDEHPRRELAELAGIYEGRGLEPALALEVARQLTAHDALAAHARDELGFHELGRPRPLQAALASAVAFIAGAALPIASAVLAPHADVVMVTTVATLAGLSLTGATAARLGGAPALRGAARVVFWGAAAMLASALIGNLFDIAA